MPTIHLTMPKTLFVFKSFPFLPPASFPGGNVWFLCLLKKTVRSLRLDLICLCFRVKGASSL
jgi:hypothetical protein